MADITELEIESFEKAINYSYAEGKLSPYAESTISKINEMVCKTYNLKFGTETNKRIKSTVLETMIANWKGFYNVKKPIYDFFLDYCKMLYNGECYKMKKQNAATAV